jgi:hypothetical protein
VLSTVTAVALIASTLNSQATVAERAFQAAEAQASSAAAEISAAFADTAAIAQQIADDLSSGALPYDAIDARLAEELRARTDIDGIAVTFQPYVYDVNQRLYQTYHFRNAAGQLEVLSGATYDYSQPPTDAADSPQTAWYHLPLEGGPQWVEPFFATGARKILIEFGTPFQQVSAPAQRGGVVTIDYSIAGMQALMARLSLGATGYGFVISQQGTFLSHPNTDLVAQSTIYEFEELLAYASLAEVAARALAGETLSVEVTDSLDRPAWVFLKPVASTGWVVGIVLPRLEFERSLQQNLQDLAAVIIISGMALVFAVALLVRAERGSTPALWAVSASYSLICAVSIVILLIAAHSNGKEEGITVNSRSAANRFAETYAASLDPSETYYRTPVGILVQSVDVQSATSATANGIVWQIVPNDAPDDFLPGILFRKVTGPEMILEELQRVPTDDGTLITWQFGFELRQNVNPAAFPFDRHYLDLRMSPAEQRYRVLLVPALDDYPQLDPLRLPGVDPTLALNNWVIESSRFTYDEEALEQRVFVPELPGMSASPALTFGIALDRRFIGPVIAYLLPGLVAAGMMFAFISGDPKVGDQEEIISTLGFTAALFFVIAITHTALRETVAAVGITYLENLFLLLYLIIILASINSFLLVRADIPLLSFRNNLISKLGYWPLIATVMLVATLGTFVYIG